MTREALRFLLLPLIGGLLLTAIVGCDARPPVRTRDGGADGDVPPVGCTPGTAGFRCEGSTAVECLADGTEASRTDCGVSGEVCVDGLGCRVCRPSSFRCNGNDVERCNDAGTGYEPHMTCDAAAGRMCNSTIGACTSACDDAAASNSYIGCEYWPVTTLNSQVAEVEFRPAVVVANPQATAVSVTVTGPGGFNQSRSVPAGATETIELPWVLELKGQFQSEASTIVRGGAYRLVSTLPVTVYQFNPLEYQVTTTSGFLGDDCSGAELYTDDGLCHSFSNDASLLLPTHVLTGNYIVLSRPTMTNDNGVGPSSSPGFFAVVGVSATPVTVDIQFRGRVEASVDGQVRAFAPGESGTFMLNQGDVLQIVGGSPPSCTPGDMEDGVTYCTVGSDYDLTGSEIRATGPVQVIAGHNCSFVPYNRYACDHLEEALFPLEAWGTETIVSKTQPPMGRTEPNVVRILSGADNNTITFDPPSVGGGSVTLNRGQIAEFEINESFRATGSEAFLLGQFVVGQNYLPSTPIDAQGDPSLSLGIPSEQFRTSYTFLAPTTYPSNFVNVTAPAGAVVTLDGAQVSGFTPVGSSGFSVAQVSISGGQHTITSSVPFGIVVYGYGSFTSYMYPGGLDFEEINIPF